MSIPANETTRASHASSVEADWIARALRAQVVVVPEAGHYPPSQRPDITTAAVLRFLESVNGRALGQDSSTPARPRP